MAATKKSGSRAQWVDRGLRFAAPLAGKSPKLTPTEKRELTNLMKKKKFTMTDRTRCVWLVRKALPESLPGRPTATNPDGAPEPGTVSEVDSLERLGKLADLRDRGALTEEEFAREKAKVLDSPSDRP